MPFTVLAVHGAVANGTTWETLRPLLGPDTVLIAPDLPGHGARRDVPFTIAASLAMLERTLSACGDGPIVLVGDSLGGYLVLALAARTRVSLAGVVAGGCTFAIAGAGGALARASGIAQDLAVRMIGEPLAVAGLGAIARRIAAPDVAAAIVQRGFRLAARAESLAELAKHDTLADVRAIGTPIVFVNGALDWPLRSGEGTFLRAARNATRVVVPGHGHGVGFTAPAAFATAIRGLLAPNVGKYPL